MKKYLVNIISVFLMVLTSISFDSCRENIYQSTSNRDVFEVIWNTIDTKYCFFKEKDVDWDLIHEKYYNRISVDLDSDSLFYIIGEMLCELRDGHVNLYSSRDVVRYWKWYQEYPENFNDKLEKIYLGDNYKISSGLRYKMLDDSIGYITYRSFSSGINESGLDYILERFSGCKGIIIDIRNNTGGDLSNVQKLAGRFTEKKIISGYISHKNGPEHDNFSDPYPIYLEPSERLRSDRNVVVLTNRLCYSAANAFACTMKQLPNVTLMGDKTGGGGGFPLNFELPNGWILRLSSCIMFDENLAHIEDGITPDYNVKMEPKDIEKNIDSIIEAAREYLALKNK